MRWAAVWASSRCNRHEEGADIGLVLLWDQQVGVGEPVMLGIERVD